MCRRGEGAVGGSTSQQPRSGKPGFGSSGLSECALSSSVSPETKALLPPPPPRSPASAASVFSEGLVFSPSG